MATYRITKKMDALAWKVLQNPSDYTSKTVREAAFIHEHYEEGASYDRKPAKFKPVKRKR